MLAAGALAHFGTAALQQDWQAHRGRHKDPGGSGGRCGRPGPGKAAAAGDGYRPTGEPHSGRVRPRRRCISGARGVLPALHCSSLRRTTPASPSPRCRPPGLGSVGELDLAGVEVSADRVVGDSAAVEWLTTLKTLGHTAFQLGVLERAPS